MMKYLLVLLIVAVAAWVMLGRRRGRGDQGRTSTDQQPRKHNQAEKAARTPGVPAMVACTHCGLHLPRADAVADAQGRLFCGDTHRLAGPR